MIRKAVIVLLTFTAFLLALAQGRGLAAAQGMDPVSFGGVCTELIRTDTVWLCPCWKGRYLLIDAALATSVPSRRVDWAVRVPLVGWFSYRARSSSVGWKYYYATVPGWLVIAVILVYPTIALLRGPVRRWRRRRKGLCIRCAYNLTGNVSGVCPECGTEIKRT